MQSDSNAAPQSGGFSASVANNLRYPYTNTERRIHTMALQELSAADALLEKYLGPNHLIRKDLARLLKDLREKLA